MSEIQKIVIKFQCVNCQETINSWHENTMLCKRCFNINKICYCEHALRKHSARTGHCLARLCLCRHFRASDERIEKSIGMFL